jgi:deazaflavin-dependent oxidoreductase (nitroreductase family)
MSSNIPRPVIELVERVTVHVPDSVMLMADRATQFLYRVTDGRVGGQQLHYSMLVLNAIGRKSGEPRPHALLYFRDGDNLVVCASNNGSPKLPGWYLNVQAQPRVWVQHGRIKREVIAETVVDEKERERLWQRLLQVRPNFAEYQKSTTRVFPMVVLKPLPGEEGKLTNLERGSRMSKHIFDPVVIHEISKKHLGEQPLEEMFANIAADLAEVYPGAIDTSKPWIFNNAGGVMLQMKLYHASLTEYIMIWGTPIGSEGHTGRHLAEFYDTVLDGEAWYYTEGQLTRDVYTQGDHVFVGKGESSGMHYPDHVWMIEYARGSMPALFPFGLADGLFSTLDYKTLGQTLMIYFSLLMKSLSRGQKLVMGTLVGLSLMILAMRGASGKRRGKRKKGAGL